MPNYSENLNLILPSKSENYNVDVANTNNKIIDAQVGNKVDKIEGKSLSTNDFTNAYKRKLDTLQNIYKFKGSVNSQTELLTITGQNSGDVYNVIQENKDYAWTGLEWVELGSATNTEDLATIEYVNFKNTEQDNAMSTMKDNIEEKINGKANCKYYAGDVNLLKESGLYYVDGSSSNIPVATYSAYVTVNAKSDGNYVYQEAEIVSNNVAKQGKYKRQCFNGTWGDWIQISNPNITTSTEYETGRIIDGKKEYGKRINIGALPNATAKYVNTGLRDITLTDGGIVGSFKNENVQRTYPEGQFSQGVSLGLIMYLSAGGGTLTITCKGDGSILSGYVTLYYTKN